MARFYLVRYIQTGDAALREELRGAHIAYRKGLGDGIALAGPILDEADKPVGSVIIISAENANQAHETATGDPFVKAGLLTVSSIEAMRIAAIKPPAD